MSRTKVLAAVLAATTIAAATSGCSQLEERVGGSSASAVEPAAASQPLEVVGWGVTGSLVSAVVVNTTDRTLRYAEGDLEARDADGQVVASTGDSSGACCAIVDLAPGASYGVYLDAGWSARAVEDVDVDIRNVAWDPAGARSATTGIRAAARGVHQTAHGAVVDAAVKVPEAGAELLVQALLEKPDGSFVAVVSGRWSCLPAGVSRIRMQLFHPVPEGTRVDQVLVHSVADEPDGTAPTCTDADRVG
jgi:hypothetical protein